MYVKDFVDQLLLDGIGERTIDLESRRGVGAANEFDQSSWKTYYRSSDFPAYGVLISKGNVHADPAHAFRSEIANYDKLRRAGFDVPATWNDVIDVRDAADGRCVMAAMVVEHIEGGAPRKVSPTRFKTVMMIGNEMTGTSLLNVKKSWSRLEAAAASMAPRDHQVIITPCGRLVTVDPEHIGNGVTLPAWDDSLRIDTSVATAMVQSIAHDESGAAGPEDQP